MDDSIDNYYLPLTSTNKVVIAFFILEGDEIESEIRELVFAIVRCLKKNDRCKDAIKFGYEFNDSNLVIFKEVPIFDIWGHLHSC